MCGVSGRLPETASYNSSVTDCAVLSEDHEKIFCSHCKCVSGKDHSNHRAATYIMLFHVIIRFCKFFIANIMSRDPGYRVNIILPNGL